MEIYSVKDLSKKMGITPKTIRHYLATGTLRGKKIARKWLVTDTAIDEFLNGTKTNCKDTCCLSGRTA